MKIMRKERKWTAPEQLQARITMSRYDGLMRLAEQIWQREREGQA
jgi:hypothetical protein